MPEVAPYSGTCRGLAEDFSLVTPDGCTHPATKVVSHSEGCSYPLCDSCADRLNERWTKDIGNTEVRPATVLDMPGGLW